jgi:prepilin-type N-terminal cleavage/methylation domain-containing protein
MSYFSTKQQSGFSLVETLVAIAILLIVIVGPMTIATNASRGTSFANEQTIAYFLAQEGLELVQKGRDDLLLKEFNPSGAANAAWNGFTGTSPTDEFNYCMADSSDGGVEQCGITINTDSTGSLAVVDCKGADAVNCKLYYDATPGVRARYTHIPGGTETDYIRIITMEETVNNQEVLVTSEVRWRSGGQLQEQNVTAQTYLFNVYGR